MSNRFDELAREKLSDNTNLCAQCKDCRFRARGKTGYQNGYCERYPRESSFKSSAIMTDKQMCAYREE